MRVYELRTRGNSDLAVSHTLIEASHAAAGRNTAGLLVGQCYLATAKGTRWMHFGDRTDPVLQSRGSPADCIGDAKKNEFSCELGSGKYFALCGLGGILSCGTTHTAIVPLDLVKCRIQVNPEKYKGIVNGFRVSVAEEGLRGLFKGWAPTLFGYSCQGLGKFGLYEVFKVVYGNALGEIPYTMMKFACFERTIEALYKYVVPKPKEDCSKSTQLLVTFTAGYIAGIFCAIISHPADTVVSKLNNEKGLGAWEALRRLGFLGVWKGLTPRIIMIGTLTAAQWFIYDGVKVALKMPRPPPPGTSASSASSKEKKPLIVD